MSVSEQDNISNRVKDHMVGKQLGDYRITSRLASGGMARIYKAMDYKLQRPAAIKILERDRFDKDESIARRFKREAQAVAALEHDNIITIYQYGEDEDEGVYFLAMKLVRGTDLADTLKKIRQRNKLMEVDRVLNIMTQIASALDYAHSQHIIHRDVKPSNILIDKDDKAILTDLGLVLRSTAETTMGTAFGTPRYISPEQATASDKAVPQSDIYSFAVILYEMLVGQTPFDGESPMEIALAHIGEQVPLPCDINPEIPEAVEFELLKSLDKNPENRHSTATEFIEAVKRGYGIATTPRAEGTLQVTQADLEGVRVVGDDTAAKPGQSRMLLVLLAIVLLAVAAFVLNGMGGGASGDGAPVTIIYSDDTFTLINEGDYTLEVQKLKFVRGVDDGTDDFSGDRIPRDELPANRNCFQIVLANSDPDVPPQCRPLQDHRQGQEMLLDAQLVPWRSETKDGSRISSFSVIYDGRELTRCSTIGRGENAECRFTWPVGPPEAAK